MKKQNGITLVALIITIIVMLILAGVALVFSVGEKGIVNRAQSALREKERTEVEEIIITSYVYKRTASMTTVVQLDLEETAKALYSNLEGADYTLKTAEDIEAQSYKDIYTEGATTISLNVEGKHGTYTGIVEKNGLRDGIKTVKDSGNVVPPEDDEEVEWVYIDYWGEGEEELHYIGKTTNLELVEDKEVKAYVGTLDEETEEMVYDENCEIISVRLSEVPYIFYEDIEELTVGELAKNISSFDGAKKVIILKEFGDVVADTFDDRGIEEVVIEEGIKNIESLAFSKNDLISVTLPKSIESIGDYAFSYSFKLETINYAGKMSEWENIEKGTNIVNSSLNIELICSDGTIEL